MTTVALADLPDWLLSHGTTSFTTQEASQLSGVAVGHVWPGLKRLADRGLIFSPARAFYVPIPPEFRQWGSVPATHFVDPMMRHLGRRYYVGLLSAAELHGVAHQRPQAFQVMVEQDLANRRRGRTEMRFYFNSAFDAAKTMTKATPTGSLVVATPETTLLDLAARPSDGGGLDNVATVAAEMAEDGLLDVAALAEVAEGYSASAARRVGWILDRYSDLDVAGQLDPRPAAATKLDPHSDRRGPIDPTWRLIVNSDVQPDR